jgi:hypothetical protein
MAEDDLLVRPPRPPWHERIRWQTWVSVISLVVALSSALFTWQLVRVGDRQAKAAEHQAKIAEDALSDARTTAASQRQDVELSRKAAQDSAKAAQDLAKGMERSARAAESSAEAGKEALRLNRRALILSNQPDVVALNSRLSQQLAPGNAPEINTQLVNLGKGAALKLENRAWIFVSPKRTFQYPPVNSPSVSDLPPGGGNLQNLALKLPFPLTAELIKAIENGTLILYVYGLSEYYDNTLDKPRKDTLHWCVYYDPTKTDKLPLVVCPEHNYTTVE